MDPAVDRCNRGEQSIGPLKRSSGSLHGQSRNLSVWLVATPLALHGALVAHVAWLKSPTVDEFAHLAAGVSYWNVGRFDLYRVNPPLSRLVTTFPVVALGAPHQDWRHYPVSSERAEWDVGYDLVLANGVDDSLRHLRCARLAGLCFSLLGAAVCYCWAKDLFGPQSGVAALCLWCFSPQILAYSSLLTCDIAAAALGVAANYAFWKWLTAPRWESALVLKQAYAVGL